MLLGFLQKFVVKILQELLLKFFKQFLLATFKEILIDSSEKLLLKYYLEILQKSQQEIGIPEGIQTNICILKRIPSGIYDENRVIFEGIFGDIHGEIPAES